MFDELKKIVGLLPKEKEKSKTPKKTTPLPQPEPVRASRPEAPTPPKSHPDRHTGKNGIPVLDRRPDYEKLFCQAEKTEPAAPPVTPVVNKAPRPKAPKKKVKKDISRNRKGMRVLDAAGDLEKMMLAEEPLSSAPAREKIAPDALKVRPTAAKKKHRPPSFALRDKNGLPILREATDFVRAFGADKAPGPSATRPREQKPEPLTTTAFSEEKGAEPFGSLLHDALGRKSRQVMMREKIDQSRSGKPMTLERRLRQYPACQKTLDLHGFSAIQARLKTEIFVQQAKDTGLATIRIIVGRGLHSDGPAVLPEIVEAQLSDMTRQGILLAHTWEGEGALPAGSVLVYIRHFD